MPGPGPGGLALGEPAKLVAGVAGVGVDAELGEAKGDQPRPEGGEGACLALAGERVPGGAEGAGVGDESEGIAEAVEREAVRRGLAGKRGEGREDEQQAPGTANARLHALLPQQLQELVRRRERGEPLGDVGSLANCAIFPSTGRYWLDTSSGGATIRKKSDTGRLSMA